MTLTLLFRFTWFNPLTLKYYCYFFVTLMISSGLPDPVFKNKKIPFPSTAVYHKNYTENISLTEQFEHLQSYFTLMWYDVWWKVSRQNIAKVSGMPKIQLLIKQNYGRKQLLHLYTANTIIEACPEWVSAFYRLCPHKPYSGVRRTPPPHTNTIVGSARHELTSLCKI